MDKQQAKGRMEKLKKEIRHHSYLYHVLDKQEISDAAFDALKNELEELEYKFPDLITSDSPTQRVSGKPLKKFEKFQHPFPMFSFFDAFGKEEMIEWLGRNDKVVKNSAQDGFYCELKIDGLAIELVYENGILKTGATRGDGEIGENVTNNLKTVASIPLKLSGNYPKKLVVKGEVFLDKKEFGRLNKELEKKGEKIYANPRNLAAGSVRQLDPKIISSRRLDSFAYAVETDLGQKTHEEEHGLLKKFGFKINLHNKFCKDLQEVEKFRNYWIEHREKLDYEIDGIVVIVNNNKIFEDLGVVGKGPRGAIAYKFSAKEATTTIKDVIWQVGRTGVLTPVAILEPVEIGGATITHATLHNFDEIKRLKVKIGDTVVVGRAGDVIPDIVKVLDKLRTGKEKEIRVPLKCPICGSKVLKIGNEVAYRCSDKNCGAIQREKIYHFVSKNAFDIAGVGPKIIDRFLDGGPIKDAADLFLLKEDDIKYLERFAEKSATNIINSIQSKKTIKLEKFLFALGIPQVGEETAFDLVKYISAHAGRDLATGGGNLDKIKNSSFEELMKIRDIGPKVAKSIHGWFGSKKNIDFLRRLNKTGIKIQAAKKLPALPAGRQAKLQAKIFVFTGELKTMSREAAKEKVRELGGDASESVSKDTDFAIVGAEPGSKYDKAKKLGVKIINEKEFIKLIK